MRRIAKGLLILSVFAGLGIAFFLSRAQVRTAEVVVAPQPGDTDSLFIGPVSVFDGETLLRDRDVLVRGSTIVSVSPAGSQPPPTDALRIEGQGRTLLPGLVDSHAHLLTSGAPAWGTYLPDVAANARAMLYCGVTSVLVAQSGADEDRLISKSGATRAAVPHLFVAGPALTAPGGHPIPFVRALLPWPLSTLVTSRQPTAATEQEARAQVARIHDQHHPPLFKIFFDAIPPGTPQISKAVLIATVAAARERGMRPVAHIGSSADMVTAAEAGVALLMHPPSQDLLSEDQIAQLRRIGTPFVTTVRTLLAADEVARGGGTRLERETMDGRLFTTFAQRPQGWSIKGFERVEAEFPQAAARMRENTQRLIRGGVPFFVGTDAGVFGVFPGASLLGELVELARAGVAPLALLRAATSAPAAFLDPAHSFGRVAAGQRADLLLVRGDPVADIAALSAIEEVWLSGARLLRKPVVPR